MDIRKLKNPTRKDATFVFSSREYRIKAGETESFPEEVVKFYLQHVNGSLIEPEEDEESESREDTKEEPK